MVVASRRTSHGVLSLIKKFLAAIALSLSFFSPAVALDKAELPKAEQQMFLPVVQLGEFCSGSVVYSNRDQKSGEVTTYVLTAKHCTDKVDQKIQVNVPVYTNGKKLDFHSYRATVKGRHWKSDTAVLKIDNTTTLFENVVKLAAKDTVLTFGEDAWTVGYPLGLSRTVTQGEIGNRELVPTLGPSEFQRATPDIGPGNSGGALFVKNAKGDYEQVGVTTGGARGMPFFGVYTPLEDIHDALKVIAPEVVGAEVKRYTPASN